jgi:hypothetical protein
LKISLSVRFAGLAALSVAAGPAQGLIPPPPPIAVAVVGDSPETQAQGEALATILGGLGWFSIDAAAIDRASLRACTDQPAPLEACFRKTNAWKANNASVLILASGSPVQKWTCVGVGAAAKAADRQTPVVDLKEAIFGTPERRFRERNKAAACIIAAASEGGW